MNTATPNMDSTPMMMTRSSFILHPSSFRYRGGFSFAEVLFAVIILGIGFIMVAAIFPVAIQQTKLTVDESKAAAIAKDAVSTLERLAAGSDKGNTADKQLFRPTEAAASTTNPPPVWAIRDWADPNGVGQPQPGTGSLSSPAPSSSEFDLWNRLRGNLFNSADPRFAWTALYSREADSSLIRVYLFILQTTERQSFNYLDITNLLGAVNLQPRLVRVAVDAAPTGSAEPDAIRFLEPQDRKYPVQGGFVVIAGDISSGTPLPSDPTGVVYRLAAQRGRDNDIYEVDPAYDVPDGFSYNALAWVIGRSFVGDPNVFDPPTAGPAMDVALYTTFLKVN